MRSILITIILLLTAAGSLSAERTYIKMVEKAEKAVADGDYLSAIDYLKEALRAEPDNSGNVMLISNLGMLQYYTGQDSLALASISIAHNMAPESITILNNRVKILTQTGRYRVALTDCDKIISLDSTLYTPHLQKGSIYLALADTTMARQELDRVCELTDPDKSLEVSAALAWLAQLTDDNKEALRRYNTLIQLAPNADMYAARALCHVKNEDYPDASEDISEALKLDDRCAEIYVVRALLNKRTYRLDDALADAQRAVDLGADKGRIKKLLDL